MSQVRNQREKPVEEASKAMLLNGMNLDQESAESAALQQIAIL